MSDQSASDVVVDVRHLLPTDRHRTVVRLVERLRSGMSFLLVNDHDPRRLQHQLETAYPEQLSWTYVERGPDVWRIEIARRPAA